MKSWLFAALCLLPLSANAVDRLLGYDTWARPRSASAVLQMPAVADAMRDWSQAVEGSRLYIRYPGGESGNLWALELRDWLVALGLPLERIVVSPGSARADELLLFVAAPEVLR
jgi:hypothetical protein